MLPVTRRMMARASDGHRVVRRALVFSPEASPFMITAEDTDSPLVDRLLSDQHRLTAVERFARAHDRQSTSDHSGQYRDLIPITRPQTGEQYAFEVDLDGCSGCKSCVAACHALNGLEETETWRSVGLLHGGSAELPILQHVTTACHHCIEPACMDGCPVEAYEKDEQTGIVRHLDDQCIGCKYCIFKCPYDVPKYSHSKGIVRKCDMCHQRLEADEPPACVQACPNQAIKITIVDQSSVISEGEAEAFLPGAPNPSYTLPTTVYRTDRVLPRNLLPADYFSAQPQHAHWPLVGMLVLTQMSVGAFIFEQLLTSSHSWSIDAPLGTHAAHLAASMLLGLFGMVVALFHLGRPLYAFRALIGLRRSWLSREILAFTLFPITVSVYAATRFSEVLGWSSSPAVVAATGAIAALNGILAVLSSAMVYADTNRPFWNATFTITKFVGTSVVLGLPVALVIGLIATALAADAADHGLLEATRHSICLALIVATLAKLTFESLIFVSLHERVFTPLKRTAYLLTHELGLTTIKRYFFACAGGLILPGLLLYERWIVAEGFNVAFWIILVLFSSIMLLIGELLERYLFFAAVVAPKMPGVAT